MTSLHAAVNGGAMRTIMLGGKPMTAMDLQRIKNVLEACGVAEVHGSPHIYAHPESIHIIAPQDLSFLVAHSEVLATHADLKYDVRAFTGILWGMMQHAERHVEQVLRASGLEAPGMAVAATPASMDATAAVTKGGAGTAALATAPTVSSTPATATAPEDSNRSSAIQNLPGYADIAALHTAVYANLVQVFRVTALLRAFEDANARVEVRVARRVTQVDIDVMARLATLLTRLFLCLGGEAPVDPAGVTAASALNVTASYTSAGHHLFRTTETAVSSVMMLLAALAARPGSDARRILRYFHGVDAWKASALGLQVTESYGLSVQALLFALVQRRRDFDNVDAVVARLLLTRLATRPPYQWRPFRLLYFSVQEIGMGAAKAAEDRLGSSAFGQLLQFRRIQRALQWCLTTSVSDTAEEVATVRTIRRAVSAQVQVDWAEDADTNNGGAKGPRLLSYYELLVLAALQGMPEADLTKDAQLVRRAVQTRLSSEPEVLSPSFLRLLLACSYTVPTARDATTPHSLLSPASTLMLYESISKHVFQISLCAGFAGSKKSNELYAAAGLRVDTLVDLCVWNAVQNGREDAFETGEQPGTNAETGETMNTKPATMAALPPPLPTPASGSAAAARPATTTTASIAAPPLPALPRPPSPVNALFQLMRRDVGLLFQGNEEVLKHTPEARRVRAKNFPPGFCAMTLATTKLLFTALCTADLFHSVPSTEMLPTVAQLFALRAYYPVPQTASAKQRKETTQLMRLMQNTLASLPQQMNAATVNDLLRRQLVPMSTTVAQTSRLQLALFEAYLRAMATASAANAVTDDTMLQFWADVAVPAITNRHSAALANAGHDFLVSAFRAEKYVSPLFVPTYVALYVPNVELSGPSGTTVGRASPYPPLSVPVIQHFARSVRSACHGIEQCDATALARLFSDDEAQVDVEGAGAASDAAVSAYLSKLSPTQQAAVKKITPTSAVLLVVSALFDRLCLLWNSTPGYVKVARDLFMAYFSGLCNLLQCANTAVVQRVCASIEAIEVEHLRGSGNVQFQFLKYVSAVVDNVQGSSKVGIAEWYLKMNKRIMEQNYGKNSKL